MSAPANIPWRALAFQYTLGDSTVLIADDTYDLRNGRVFLCESISKVRQLPIQLRSNVYLSSESVKLRREHLQIKEFADSSR